MPVLKKIIVGSFIRLHLLHLSIKSLEWDHHYWILYKNNLVAESVALLDFITYLVSKIIFIESNIGDPTLEI